MSLRPFVRLLVKPLDVGVELRPVHPPHAAPADLYGRKLAGANERVNLGHADREICRHIVKGQKARLDLRSSVIGSTGLALGHDPTIAPDEGGYLHLKSFAAVWRKTGSSGGSLPCR